jgi:hypothetical protein
MVVFGDQIWSVITSGPVIWCSRHSGSIGDGERRCGRGRTRFGHVVARLPWATPVWLSGSGSGLGVGGRGWVSISHLSPSISSFHCKERKKKSGVLFVCDFLAPGLRVNFSLVGKQSLLSATAKLKLFSS